ncbi:MAG TPA: hypothetical protein VG295_08405 [Solirubrobacteraceae bacterium]|nr:hypothetical protein [Solirubrobacteraceae bacterium]
MNKRQALRALLAALAVGVVASGCGSSKPATHATGTATGTAASTPTPTTTKSATPEQAKRPAGARRRARPAAAAARAKPAPAARQQAKGAVAEKKGKPSAAYKQPATHPKKGAGHSTAPKPKGSIVSINETKLGGVLIGSKGATLYLFAKDPPGKSACAGACAGVWPPLLTTGTPVAGQGTSQSKLGTIARVGGAEQVTYNGHPLYTFVGDTHAGQTTGEGVNQFGGLWWAVSAAGEKVSK